MSKSIGGGFRVRVGGTRGHYTQGTEAPTVIDTGTMVLTDRRLVFLGPKRTQEWVFDKLLGHQHYSDQPWTVFQVSNRQKTTGTAYPQNRVEEFRLFVDLAIDLRSQGASPIEASNAIRESVLAERAQVVPGEPPSSPTVPGAQAAVLTRPATLPVAPLPPPPSAAAPPPPPPPPPPTPASGSPF